MAAPQAAVSTQGASAVTAAAARSALQLLEKQKDAQKELLKRRLEAKAKEVLRLRSVLQEQVEQVPPKEAVTKVDDDPIGEDDGRAKVVRGALESHAQRLREQRALLETLKQRRNRLEEPGIVLESPSIQCVSRSRSHSPLPSRPSRPGREAAEEKGSISEESSVSELRELPTPSRRRRTSA